MQEQLFIRFSVYFFFSPCSAWSLKLNSFSISNLNSSCLIYLIENQNESLSAELKDAPKLVSNGINFNITDLPSSFGSDVRLTRHRGSCAVFFMYKVNLQQSMNLIPKTSFALEESIPFLIFQETIRWAQINTDKFIPPVIQAPLVFISESPREILMFCILCSKSNSLHPMSQNFTSLTEIHAKFKHLNGHGHGHKAYLYSSEYGELQNLRNTTCSTDSLLKSRPEGCYMSQIFFSQADKVLNITFGPSSSTIPSGRRKGLYVTLAFVGASLDPDNYLRFRIKIYRQWTDSVIFYYVQKNVKSRAEKGWRILLDPLDEYIWVGLCLSVVSVALFYRSVNAGIEVLKCSLLQPIKTRKSAIWASLVLVTIVSYGYQAIITRDLIAKPPLARIDDVNDLLRMGYKYFTASGSAIAAIFPAIVEKIEIKDFYRDIPGYNMFNIVGNLDLLTEEKGVGAIFMIFKRIFAPLKIQEGVYDLGDRKLFSIIESDRQNIYVHWTTTWNLSGRMFALITKWREMGVTLRWDYDNSRVRLAQIFDYANKHMAKGSHLPKPLVLEDAIRFIFFVACSLLGIAGWLLFLEVVWHNAFRFFTSRLAFGPMQVRK